MLEKVQVSEEITQENQKLDIRYIYIWYS